MGKLLGAYIEITGKCNAACPYCYNEIQVGYGGSIPRERLISVLSECKELGINSVTFSGGEPFLHEDLPVVLQNALDNGMTISTISNGTCFRDEYFQILKQFQLGVQITFDGYNAKSHDATRGTGNFELISNGIMNAHANGYNGSINVRINLHRGNIGHIGDILDMLAKFDVDNENRPQISSITPAFLHRTESGGSAFKDYIESDEYTQYPDIIDKFNQWNAQHKVQANYDFNKPDIGCPFNGEFSDVECGIRIAPDGNVFPCQLFTDEKFSIGNIFQNTLQEIVEGEKLAAFIDAVHSRRTNAKECGTCGYKGMCAGGCPAQAYIENGTLDSITARCRSRKAYFNGRLVTMLRNRQAKQV
jgi:radical SAM protein with 4Fe4S-binding SPASM domain